MDLAILVVTWILFAVSAVTAEGSKRLPHIFLRPIIRPVRPDLGTGGQPAGQVVPAMR